MMICHCEGVTDRTVREVVDGGATGNGAVVQHFFVRPIAGRTLATFKAIAEAVVAEDLGPPGPASASEPADG